MDPPVAELVVKESNVAMWHLQKRTVWVEIKQRIFKIVPVISLIEKARPVGGAVHAFEKSTSTAANVVQYTFNNATWTSVGAGPDIPGQIPLSESRSTVEMQEGACSLLDSSS